MGKFLFDINVLIDLSLKFVCYQIMSKGEVVRSKVDMNFNSHMFNENKIFVDYLI